LRIVIKTEAERIEGRGRELRKRVEVIVPNRVVQVQQALFNLPMGM
jgi:hypothetical protein